MNLKHHANGDYVVVAIMLFVVAYVANQEDLFKHSKDREPISSLMKLYAHKHEATKELEQCRVNPDFRSPFRIDLEFFIPQICSFYLKGNLDSHDELVGLITQAAQTSFFFSHRLWFFFKSIIFGTDIEAKKQIDKANTVLKGIMEASLNSKERLYLANSEFLIENIIKFDMVSKYPQLKYYDQLEEIKTRILKQSKNKQHKRNPSTMPNKELEQLLNLRIEKVRQIMNEYNENNFLKSGSSSQQNKSINQSLHSTPETKQLEQPKEKQEIVEEQEEIIITAKDIILFPFNPDKVDLQGKIQASNEQQNNIVADENALKKKLSSMRNYAILHIAVEEAKVFQTKERAPLLLCIEAFRPDEINDDIPWSSSMSEYEKHARAPLLDQDQQNPYLDNPYAIKEKKRKNTKIDQGKRMSFKKAGGKRPKLDEDSSKKLTQVEKQADKINKQADLRISNPLIIKKKNDSIFNEVNVQEDYFNQADRNLSKTQLPRISENIIEDEIMKDIRLNKKSSQIEHEQIKSNGLEVIFLILLNQQNIYEEIKQEDDAESNAQQSLTKQSAQILQSPGQKIEIIEVEKRSKSKKFVDDKPIEKEQQDVYENRRTLSQGASYERTDLNNMDFEKEEHDKNKLQNQDQFVLHEASKNPRISISSEAFFKDRPANNIFLETSKEQDERVRQNSPFGNLKSWKLFKVIVKSNDDVRQEQFAMQLISQIDQIFKLKNVKSWVKTYEILATGERCGLIEVACDALSVDSIKKKMGEKSRLIHYFEKQFGVRKSKKFKKARDNFCKSLAAYSLICYILQIKDRHNGNILIDIEGHIMHIDFGFLLSNAPGKGLRLEKAPFKLTQEMVEILGGITSKKFSEFRVLMREGFKALLEHSSKVITLVEMMVMGQHDLSCFIEGEKTIKDLKLRFLIGQKLNELQVNQYVDRLIEESYDNWRTKAYDKFQMCCQGILQ